MLSSIFRGKQSYKEIASSLGMTLQGVLYHINLLKSGKFLAEDGSVTRAGYDHLYRGLKEVSDLITRDLDFLHGNLVWEAFASSPMKKGDSVHLSMKNGYLRASASEEGAAQGTSDRNAGVGDIVGITHVEGTIDYKIGEISIVILPDIESVTDPNYLLEKIKEKLKTDALMGVIGEEAWQLATQLGKIDFEFAVLDAAYDAAIRGLSSTILVSGRRFLFLSRKLAELSEQFPQVRIGFNSI